MNEKVQKIVFLDKICDCDAGDALFVALKPEVYSYLRQKGFNVVTTRPYFDNKSHQRILARSAAMVKWIEENADFLDFNLGTKDSFKNSLIFYSRFAFHYCMWVIEIVLNAVTQHEPAILSSHVPSRRYSKDSYICPEEGYTGYLVRKIARQFGFKYEDISALGRDSKQERILNHRSVLRPILKLIDFNLWETGLLRRQRLYGERPVIFTTRRYNMNKLADRLSSALPDGQIDFLKGPIISDIDMPDIVISLLWPGHAGVLIEQKKRLKEFIKKASLTEDLFIYEGIKFSEILHEKYDNSIITHIISEVLWALRLDRFFDKVKPSLVISSANRSDDVIIAELCRKKNINTVLISHGSIVRPKNECEEIEWMEHQRNFSRIPFTAYALQTPLMEDYFKKTTPVGRPIKTGPLIWGAVVDREKSKALFGRMFPNQAAGSKVIVHAGTPKQALTRPHVYETADEYLDALHDLADAVNKIDNALLIIRFRPTVEISQSDISMRVPFSEKIKLSINETFGDVIGLADLLVSFSSTAIEEALQNRIPVLQYGGEGRYQHIPGQEIGHHTAITKSAVYHVREKDDLGYAIQGILSLDIDSENDAQLFTPYIYGKADRIAFEDVVKHYSR